MCVIIYDNLQEENDDADEKLVQKIKSELLLRKQLLLDTEPTIVSYIKVVVFPVLGLNYEVK